MKKLHERLRELRKLTGWSQEAFGIDCGLSGPGYIKLENGQRLPSDKVIYRIVNTVTRVTYLNAKNAAVLVDELLTMKGLASNSEHVRKMAGHYATTLPGYKRPQITPPRRKHGPRAVLG